MLCRFRFHRYYIRLKCLNEPQLKRTRKHRSIASMQSPINNYVGKQPQQRYYLYRTPLVFSLLRVIIVR